ncbi:hypothetical protein bcere0011_14810 [Bacillus cereus m1550]|nr:hypothetical protein bcere0011_14810 [Bacillus cereus m1550]
MIKGLYEAHLPVGLPTEKRVYVSELEKQVPASSIHKD